MKPSDFVEALRKVLVETLVPEIRELRREMDERFAAMQKQIDERFAATQKQLARIEGVADRVARIEGQIAALMGKPPAA